MYATSIDTINETLDLQYLLLMEEILAADMVNIPLFAGFYTSLVGKLAGFLPSTYSPNTKVNCPIPPWQSNRAEPPQHHLYVGQHGWTSTQEISEMCSQKQGRTAGL